jgi:hypothetical protein
MEIANLMLIDTRPVAWDDPYASDCMTDFLLSLLDSEKPGLAMLGRPTPDAPGTYTWIGDREGAAVVESTCADLWLPSARVLRAGGVDSKIVWERLSEQRMDLFLDRARLDACLGGAADDAPEWLYYLGLSVLWAYVHRGVQPEVFCMPELRLSNFWPGADHLAPPSNGVYANRPLSVEDAAGALASMQESLEHLLLGSLPQCAKPEIDLRRVVPPVFHWAEPTTVPARAEGYVGSGLSSLDRLYKATLATRDPLGTGTTGAVLEGSVVALRREAVDSTEAQARYLLLPCGLRDGQTRAEGIETDLTVAVRRLSFVELTAALRAHDLADELAGPAVRIRLWSGAIDRAVDLTRELHDVALYEPDASPVRKKTYYLVHQIRRALARLEGDVLRVTDDQQWRLLRGRKAIELATDYLTRQLAVRPVAEVAPLTESLPEFFTYRWLVVETSAAAERSSQLRETFHGVERSIHGLLEEERREEREREAKLLREARDQQERGQRRLTYALAALAAVTAFPILIGQMDWRELRLIVDDWPTPFSSLGSILRSVHPYLVLVATVSAAATITALLGLLVWTVVRPQQSKYQEPAPDELESVGRAVQEVWQLAGEAARAKQSGLPDAPARLDELDRRACDLLAQVWEWLDAQTEARADEADVDRLERDVRRFVILTELFARRPEPFQLPLALCVLRFKSTDFYATSVVSDVEFEQTFTQLGFDEFEIAAIRQCAESEPRSPEELVRSLREQSVIALHAEMVLPPVDRA